MKNALLTSHPIPPFPLLQIIQSYTYGSRLLFTFDEAKINEPSQLSPTTDPHSPEPDLHPKRSPCHRA